MNSGERRRYRARAADAPDGATSASVRQSPGELLLYRRLPCKPRSLRRRHQRELSVEPARRLRERVYKNELTTGLLVSDHAWPDLVEVSVRAGLDYLIVDMEHGCASLELVAEVCATGRRLN